MGKGCHLLGKEKKRREYRSPVLRTRKPCVRDRAKAAGLLKLVKAHTRAGQADAALEAAIFAVVRDPSSSEVRLLLGRAFYTVGLFQEALDWTDNLDEEPRAQFLRGCVFSDLGKHARAAELFARALELQPGMTQAHLRGASALLADGQTQKALDEVNILLDMDSENILARILRASVLMDQGLAKKALKDMELIPKQKATPVHARLHARCAVLSGLSPQAVDEIFESYLRLFPGHASLRLAFAQHLLSRKDVDPRAFQRSKDELGAILAMEHLPRQMEAQACFSLAELEMESDPERASVLFHRGLDASVDDARGLAGLGSIFLKRSRPDLAMPWLLRALMSDPERHETMELLVEALAVITDEDAVGRWLALLFSGLPTRAPMLMSQALGHLKDKGRQEAYLDVRRLAHRMKNRVAVLATRVRAGLDPDKTLEELDTLYDQWSRFLDSMGHGNGSMEPLSIKDLVKKALGQVVDHVHRVDVILPMDLPLVRGNEQQIVDALANIVANALQASAKDTRVQVAARASASGRYVEIAVMDYGQGMDSATLSKVFTPGYTTRARGSGVGLFVARNVIVAHGGKVTIFSAPGGPTTVSIRLPSLEGLDAPSVGTLDELLGSSFEGGQVD